MKRKKQVKPKIRIDVLTLFPSMFEGPMTESLLSRAVKKNLVNINILDLRNFSEDKRRTVDDRPFGGGAGMVIKPEPVYKAFKKLGVLKNRGKDKPYVIYLSPQGKIYNQAQAYKLSRKKHLVFLCGHYEGIDERIMDMVDMELSMGDFVLTGGELPAMFVIDSLARLIPGVVKEQGSLINDSFGVKGKGILDYPQFTRPRTWRGREVPQVLFSGNHNMIRRWRERQALKNTSVKRPELLGSYKR